MLVFSYDYTTGAFTGPVTLDLSDIDPRATDTLLVPGNCTLQPPPNYGRGLWPFWRDGRWQIYEAITIEEPFFSEYDA